MKETIIICVSLALVFVPSFIFKNYLDKTGKDVLQILESMNEDIKNEVAPDEEKSKVLEKVYLEKEKKWILIVDHDILDEIEDGIAECIAYYNDEEKTEFISAYNKLKEHIKDLKKREEISLANIM